MRILPEARERLFMLASANGRHVSVSRIIEELVLPQEAIHTETPLEAAPPTDKGKVLVKP